MRRALLLLALMAIGAASVVDAASKPTPPAKPGVTTGAARNIQKTTATVAGSVNPKGSATTYVFDYGPTTGYGSRTDPVPVGGGTTAVAAKANLTGLTPGTLYHYRLVATNTAGTTNGRDRTFTTKAEPLVFGLTATPNPVPQAAGVTISGQLTGTGAPNRALVLSQNVFPFTGGFRAAGAQTTTDAQGHFAFPVPSVTANTQFRVSTADRKATSSAVLVRSLIRVRLSLSSRHPRRGRKVRFFGTVTPAEHGARYSIQHRSNGVWVPVSRSFLKPLSAGSSWYSRRVRIRRSGLYRVYVVAIDGGHVSNASTAARLTVRR